MALLHEFTFVAMPLIVCISALAGRISLRPKHFTGWYESYHDIKTLTSLILCSTIFFISSVFLTVLLISSPGKQYYEENLKNGALILSIYLFAVVGFFCLPRVKDWRKKRHSKKSRYKQYNGSTLTGSDNSAASPYTDDLTFNIDIDEQPETSEESDTSGDISVRKDILRFLCVFSLAFCIQLFLVLLYLYCYHLNVSGNWPPSLWVLLSSSSLNVINTYNCDLFVLVLLLALTSCTGGLLAAIGVDYRKDGEEALTCRIRNRSRNNLDKLIKLIRSR